MTSVETLNDRCNSTDDAVMPQTVHIKQEPYAEQMEENAGGTAVLAVNSSGIEGSQVLESTKNALAGEHTDADDTCSSPSELSDEASDRQLAYEALATLASGRQVQVMSVDASMFVNQADDMTPECAGVVEVSSATNDDSQIMMLGGAISVTPEDARGDVVNETSTSQTIKKICDIAPTEPVVASKALRDMLKWLQPTDTPKNHIIMVSRSDENTTKMKCRYCKIPLSNLHQFRSHIKKHRDIVTYEPWKCPLCPYTGNIKAVITRHINVHSEIRAFLCKICGKGFNFKQKLHQHIKYHLDIRDLVCCVCDAAFHEHKTLKTHMDKIHGIDKVPRPRERSEIRAYHRPLYQKRLTMLSSQKAGSKRLATRKVTSRNKVQQRTESLVIKIDNEEEITVELLDQFVTVNNEVIGEHDSGQQFSSGSDIEGSRGSDTAGARSGSAKVGDVLNYSLCVADDEGDEGRGEGEGSGGDEMPAELQAFKPVQYGPTKTHKYTEKFRMGLIPVDNRNKRSYHNPAGYIMSRDATQTLARHKLVERENTKLERIEPNLLNYAQIHSTYGTTQVVYECKLCENGAVFLRNKTAFVAHVQKTHPSVKLWQCDLCQYKCRMKVSLIAHQRTHQELSSAGMTTDSSTEQTTHIAQVKPNPEPVYSENIANSSLVEPEDVEKQEIQDPSGDEPLTSEVLIEETGAEEPAASAQWSQESQDATSVEIDRSAGTVESEITSAEPVVLEESMILADSMTSQPISSAEPMTSTDSMLSADLSTSSQLPTPVLTEYQCINCSQRFTTLQAVHNHNCNQYSCKSSEKSFSTPELLKQHESTSHKLSYFKCPHCPKQFGSYSGYRAHAVIHTREEEGFKCLICEKILMTKGSLFRHMEVTHTDNRPFACTVDGCNKAFKSKKDLKYHQITHMKDRPTYTCTICNLTLRRPDCLRNHMRSHEAKKQFTCERCGKEYSQKATLMQHMVGHDADRRKDVCNYCGKSFVTKNYLVQHIKTCHAAVDAPKMLDDSTEQDLYMCEICSMFLSSSDEFVKHCEAHTHNDAEQVTAAAEEVYSGDDSTNSNTINITRPYSNLTARTDIHCADEVVQEMNIVVDATNL